MNYHEEILGYNQTPDGSWEPIHECKKGYIYTAAVVHCQPCGAFIRGMGGPLDAVCVDCYRVKDNL
jgi:hypothetical protein